MNKNNQYEGVPIEEMRRLMNELGYNFEDLSFQLDNGISLDYSLMMKYTSISIMFDITVNYTIDIIQRGSQSSPMTEESMVKAVSLCGVLGHTLGKSLSNVVNDIVNESLKNHPDRACMVVHNRYKLEAEGRGDN